MAEEPAETAAPEPAEKAAQAVPAGRVARLVHWGRASRLRMALVGSLFILVFGGIFATWSYLAHLAVNEQEEYTLDKALHALDSKKLEDAKNIIGEIQKQGDETPEFGGALFVLGAVKSVQAELEWSKARQRAMHLIAARYLQKAHELGVPKGREGQAKFLLGQSLIRGNHAQAGIDVLEGALLDENQPTTVMHSLLAVAYQSISEPNLSAALEHNQAVLADKTIDQERRHTASINQADILGKMGRVQEAQQYLNFVGRDEPQQALMKSIVGRLAITQAQQLPADSEQRATLAKQARQELREAQLLDPLNSDLTRQTMYWSGKSYELTGENAAAIQQYDQLSKSYGDTAESMAAMLAKADLALGAGDSEQALAGYRAVLSAVGDPVTYVNRLLPLTALRKRLIRACNEFIDTQKFTAAMALVDSLQPVFSLMEVTELKAQNHERIALSKIAESQAASHWDEEKYLSASRYHHRAAGAAYELLAKLRFASRNYTDDLWQAAENYYLGQSYTPTERTIHEYLHHEARAKQALALLRLGQAQLAQGKNESAIETLEECIEMHPGDAVIYQARLECAHAHLENHQGKRAEELLLTNLVGGSLEPTAPEWRDSLFLLGDYQYNSKQYLDAVKTLDEAVLRYPADPQALLARYTIARSFHSAADKPAKLASEAKTESERLKNRLQRDEYLAAALDNYLGVQRMLTLHGHVDSNELDRTLLRNCYMMQGSVLYQLKRFEEARKAYANISTFYQNEPFVLESFVHIANCYRRLNKPVKAKGTIEQAKLVLNRLPPDTDFRVATNFSRQGWELLLNEMSQW
ncbi:MAG: tetratricopeptide repeat protein [Bythopirellula sp.]